jgi:hypothetical protein
MTGKAKELGHSECLMAHEIGSAVEHMARSYVEAVCKGVNEWGAPLPS